MWQASLIRIHKLPVLPNTPTAFTRVTWHVCVTRLIHTNAFISIQKPPALSSTPTALFHRALLQKRPIIFTLFYTDSFILMQKVPALPKTPTACTLGTCFIHMCGLIHMCDVRHDSFICVTWDMTHSYVWRETWLIHMCDMRPDSYLWHDSFIQVQKLYTVSNAPTFPPKKKRTLKALVRYTHMIESCHTYRGVVSHIWMSRVTHIMCHVTHMHESCHTHEGVMSHKQISHVTHINESCHTYKWVCHTYAWVEWCHTYEFTRNLKKLLRKSAPSMSGMCHTYEWVMSHIYMCLHPKTLVRYKLLA